jgi:hypothetical protein
MGCVTSAMRCEGDASGGFMPQFGKQSWAAGHVTQAWMREREIRHIVLTSEDDE